MYILTDYCNLPILFIMNYGKWNPRCFVDIYLFHDKEKLYIYFDS